MVSVRSPTNCWKSSRAQSCSLTFSCDYRQAEERKITPLTENLVTESNKQRNFQFRFFRAIGITARQYALPRCINFKVALGALLFALGIFPRYGQ